MAIIQTFGTITKLHANELLNFGRTVEAKIEEKGAATLKIAALYPSYKAALQALDDSIMKIAKSAFTLEMTNADTDRDHAQSAVLGLIDIFQYHYDPALRSQAAGMSPVYDTFKSKTQVSYEEQSGIADNLVQTLESDKYKASVAALGLTGWVANLKAKNQICKDLSTTRTAESGERNAVPKLLESRKQFEKSYTAVVVRLNALAEVNGDSAYLELFGWWNALVDRYRLIITNRLGAGKGGSTSKGDDDHPVIPPEQGGGSGGEDRPEIE